MLGAEGPAYSCMKAAWVAIICGIITRTELTTDWQSKLQAPVRLSFAQGRSLRSSRCRESAVCTIDMSGPTRPDADPADDLSVCVEPEDPCLLERIHDGSSCSRP